MAKKLTRADYANRLEAIWQFETDLAEQWPKGHQTRLWAQRFLDTQRNKVRKRMAELPRELANAGDQRDREEER